MTTPFKSGTEFLINTTTAGEQYEPAITALADGRFVVTWTDWSLSGGVNNGEAVHAKVFNADGSAFGAEFLVTTTTAGNQWNPAITALTDGRFVVAWSDWSASGGDTSGEAVRAQVFTADGAKSGAEFVVNTTTAGNQGGPEITSLADGRFVVSWTDQSPSGGDTSSYAVRGQVFAGDGAKLGAEFLINTTTANIQFGPAITTLANGRFVVSWTDGSASGGDTSGRAVRAQVFNADGTKFGAEFLVNTTTANIQFGPAIATLANGRFVVSWQDDSASGGDTSASAVRAQVFNANGTKFGAEILVNTSTANYQYDPAIAALPDGRFVVSWTDGSASGSDISGAALRAQVFNADGTKAGAEFQVNTTTLDEQDESAITVLADGRFVVSWTDHSWSGGDTSGAAVRGQIFDPRISAVALTGTQGHDEFYGTTFADVMAGRSGNDTLSGAGGDDRLIGGHGDDVLRGGNGRDRLIGDTGKDILTGGGNVDLFVFMTAAHSAMGPGRDRITDFRAGTDKLDFRAFMSGGTFIEDAAFTADKGPQVRYSVAGKLSGDVDGDGMADFQLTLSGAPILTDADILF